MSWRRPGRNWHEIYLLFLAAATGATGLIAPHARSQSIEASFPVWGQICWYVGLLVGALGGVAGILLSPSLPPERVVGMPPEKLRRRLNRQITGLAVERAAMLLLTGLCVAYFLGAVTLVGVTRVTGALGAVFVLGFALANATRAREIRLTLQRVRTSTPDASRLGEQP